MRILLVEDDNLTIESIRLCLEIYEPESKLLSTDKGLDAIKLLQESPCDAVIIDLGLPDIDGMEVLEKIRRFSRIPALILTARHNTESVNRARELGADDFITKPFNYRVLLNQLHTVMDKVEGNGAKGKNG
jgi:DNA-binding response OmpR family regulator